MRKGSGRTKIRAEKGKGTRKGKGECKDRECEKGKGTRKGKGECKDRECEKGKGTRKGKGTG